MSIKLLPAELANQIAAGEVVERPASVVKELVENSIDSGATKIEIEIAQGGHKRILVRDNGRGIDKDQLQLALSRHATSKIHCLDDLESIQSMGFRGEALASISSVSRLTLTSKPQAQPEAWQAQAFGREMQVEVRPAAHPTGTSVEVLDLFFNTPARRRFLRTEKTEFAHIDATFKRIALANQDLDFVLTHNGKRVKQLKKTDSLAKRCRDLLGQFEQQALIEIDSQCSEARVYGFLVHPEHTSDHPDWQYSFVNHRPMRDKLINHAIKQALELMGLESTTPQYVLFVDVDPYQVDVNVHPAKHEVRFHQARAIHDFLVSTLRQAIERQVDLTQLGAQPIVGAGHAQHHYDVPTQLHSVESIPARGASPSVARPAPAGGRIPQSSAVAESANAYTQLMNPAQKQSLNQERTAHDCMFVDDVFVVAAENGIRLMQHAQLLRLKVSQELAAVELSQPLLMPVVLPAAEKWSESLRQAFETLHIHIDKLAGKLLLKQVPAGWRSMPWSQIADSLLNCQPAEVEQHILALLTQSLMSSSDKALLKHWWLHLTEELQCQLLEQHAASISIAQLSELTGLGESHDN